MVGSEHEARPRWRIAIGTLVIAAALTAIPVINASVASGAPATASPSGVERSSSPCPLKQRDGESVQKFSERVIRCSARQWKVPGGVKTALCIARRESGLNPKALSPDKLNRGLFQQHRRWWASNRDTYTRKSWHLRPSAFNARTNTIVSIRMAADDDIGWKPWGGRRC
jgi:hypothetical protein